MSAHALADALLTTALPFPVRRGKVRDVYDLGDALLIVATDRISAFDCVMPNGIPDKGKLLTALSLFWFDLLADVENHLIATDLADYPAAVRPFADQLVGRSMLVRKATVVPIECVARGYLAGSGWKEYQQSQTVCGVPLPPGLRLCDALPEPIFTPATKEESGHDVNVDFAETARRVGEPLAADLRDRTLSIYRRAADHARSRGVIIADTKFEFGLVPSAAGGGGAGGGGPDKLILVDEILTPDSSRFWPAGKYEAGRDQPSFDKQYVRNWLEGQPWDKAPPAPPLPPDVVANTRAKYVEAYEAVTGKRWP
jgi:phosphoribosylaminoimidazole-succinocarboxamide synthase